MKSIEDTLSVDNSKASRSLLGGKKGRLCHKM